MKCNLDFLGRRDNGGKKFKAPRSPFPFLLLPHDAMSGLSMPTPRRKTAIMLRISLKRNICSIRVLVSTPLMEYTM